MPYKLMDLRIAREDSPSCSAIESRIADIINAPHPPSAAVVASLVHRDVLDQTLAVLNPGDLVEILRHSLQGTLPYRIARFFHAIPIRGQSFDLDDLRALGTRESRLGRAALGDIKWSDASHEERKILLTRHVLRAIAAGRAS